MRTLRAIPLFVLALSVLAPPASAGVYYRAVTTTETLPKGPSDRIVVEARVEGENARIDFEESGNPLAHAGSYLVTTDGGKTVYLIDPEEKTYAEWDIEGMLKLAGAVMEGMGPMMSFDFSEPQVEKLAEEDGGTVVGLPTRHYRYRTTYSVEMKILGMKRSSAVENVQDVWTTDRLDDQVALGVWLRKEPPSTGNEDLDRLVRSELGKIDGFPLKTVTVSTTQGGKKGKQESVTRSVTEVTELRLDEPALAAATWEIPAGFQQVEMLPAGEQAAEGEEQPANPLSGLFGRKKKDG